MKTKTLQTIANIIARKYGHSRATAITFSGSISEPVLKKSTRFGYRKTTTGEYVPNSYRNNFGWKNTYYQCAECEIELPTSFKQYQ
ncbi:MAG: hypothetical protein PHC28_05845 [Flavobacterium sp.]|uniref:hypothetical protein n=1 Tax=Flavobacterium sp. TaxID=239 RepID=UPI0026084444|nr:hypothetical protein [Flavobacterium sp.]MDD5149991.1 hypothetical protein [Flavobacterium sp.]